jgi:hypothetical protein
VARKKKKKKNRPSREARERIEGDEDGAQATTLAIIAAEEAAVETETIKDDTTE